MKTNDLLNLDCREEKSKRIIQKALKIIKPLAKYSDEQIIPLEKIEKAINIMTNKYAMCIQWITPSKCEEKYMLYSLSIKNDDDYSWVGTVYGVTIYEVFAKCAILMYATIKGKKVILRKDSETDKRRKLLMNKKRDTK